MGVSTNTEIVDFTAGMNTVKANHLIAPNESRILVNVDITNGSLLSVPSAQRMNQAANPHFIEFNEDILYYANFRTNARMDNNLYWADGLETGKVLWDGRELPLGIPTPATPCTIASALVTPNGEHSGDFKYTYTFYSTDTGVESAPANLPPYLTVDKDNIVIDGLEAFPMSNDPVPVPIADRYRIYRIGGYLPRFTMVAELEGTAFPYTDELDDTEIDGRLLSTLHTEAPPSGLNDFVELNGRLFGSRGTDVFFSALGNADAWYSSNFFTMPDSITGMAKSPAGLLVFGNEYTYLLLGSDPSNFRLKVISNILGCISRSSIAYLKDSVVWLSKTGICLANGYQILDLTSDKIETVVGIEPTSACVLNEVYYLSFKPSLYPTEELFPSDTLFPGGAIGTGDLSEGIIYLDFKRGRNYSYGIFDFKSITSLGVVDGKLYNITSIPNTIFMDCTNPLLCDDYLQCTEYELNVMNKRVGSDVKKLRYVSPIFIDGSYSTLKQYDKIRINLTGTFDIKAVFSDGSVAVEESVSIKEKIAVIEGEIVTKNDITTIGIPNSHNTSYSIAFIINGYGVIKSIQYSWKNRELP